MLATSFASCFRRYLAGSHGQGAACRGFNLVELMVGVAIIAVMLAIAAPGFRAWILNAKIRAAGESVLTGLQNARAEAVRRNAQVFFELQPVADATLLWRIGCVNPVAGGDQDCPAVINRGYKADGGLNDPATNNLIVTLTTANGGDMVIFDTLGRKRTTPVNARDFTQLDINLRTDVMTGARVQRVLILAGGTSRMCDPQLPATDMRACP